MTWEKSIKVSRCIVLFIYACSPITGDAGNAVDINKNWLSPPIYEKGRGEGKRRLCNCPTTITFPRLYGYLSEATNPPPPFSSSGSLSPTYFLNIKLGQKGSRTHHVAAGLECMTVTPPSTGTISDTLVRDLALSIEPALYA